MTVLTYSEQLESVQTAIAAIESGAQSYGTGDKRLTRGDLATLYEREKYLRAMVQREESSGIDVRGATPVDS